MVKIRVEGKPAEVDEAVKQLEGSFKILSKSDYYKNRRSEYVRIYTDVEIIKEQN